MTSEDPYQSPHFPGRAGQRLIGLTYARHLLSAFYGIGAVWVVQSLMTGKVMPGMFLRSLPAVAMTAILAVLIVAWHRWRWKNFMIRAGADSASWVAGGLVAQDGRGRGFWLVVTGEELELREEAKVLPEQKWPLSGIASAEALTGPRGVRVVMRDGSSFTFRTHQRNLWKKLLEEVIAGHEKVTIGEKTSPSPGAASLSSLHHD